MLHEALHAFRFTPDAPLSVSGPMVRMRQGQDERTETGDEGGSLHVLTSGPLPPDPGEVIASRRMAGVLEELHKRDYDYVLVDAPPLLVVGDAAALAPSVDGLVLLAGIGKVRRPMLRSVRDALGSFPCRKIGVVVTGERVDHGDYYSYHRSRPQQTSTAAPLLRGGKRVDDRAPTAG